MSRMRNMFLTIPVHGKFPCDTYQPISIISLAVENQHTVTVERTSRVSRKSELAQETCSLCVTRLAGVVDSIRPKLHVKKMQHGSCCLPSWLGRSRAQGGSRSEVLARKWEGDDALMTCLCEYVTVKPVLWIGFPCWNTAAKVPVCHRYRRDILCSSELPLFLFLTPVLCSCFMVQDLTYESSHSN